MELCRRRALTVHSAAAPGPPVPTLASGCSLQPTRFEAIAQVAVSKRLRGSICAYPGCDRAGPLLGGSANPQSEHLLGGLANSGFVLGIRRSRIRGQTGSSQEPLRAFDGPAFASCRYELYRIGSPRSREVRAPRSQWTKKGAPQGGQRRIGAALSAGPSITSLMS
jgi:hypothetical protein